MHEASTSTRKLLDSHLEVNILGCRDILEVHFQDLPAALHVWVGHSDVPVEAARPHQGLVQGLGEVGGSYADDAITRLEPAGTQRCQRAALEPLITLS